MFYYLFHKLPLWRDLPDSKRNIRTFLLGTIVYILFHAFLFSKYSEINHNIKLYRNYIYYLWVADALGMAVIYKNYHTKNILSESTLQKQLTKLPQPVVTTNTSKSVFQKLGENSEQFSQVSPQLKINKSHTPPITIIEQDDEDDDNNDNDNDNNNDDDNDDDNDNIELHDDDSKKELSKIEEFSNKESQINNENDDEETIPLYC
jgi:hypothetical protein